ncbi:PilN domain-containing protein [Thiohalobacter sp. IOR34]|uniref:PilN domain-containing protein n=1 Tax=Thiohalobacter sp. IOR34 TaxID=3057176 RepID=UPI0025AEF4CD|nr:PilN domain-containing protein [Thiohalobacter sp. IOR34]WJW75540.1 PilN domain-containing protein [Thiohalobacter sp. IOR34]
MSELYQQINLYQPVFRREEKWLSATTLAQIPALALVLLVGSGLYLSAQLGRLQETAAQLEGLYNSQAQQLEALKARGNGQEVKALDQRIEALQTRLDGGRQLLASLDSLSLPSSGRFSNYLAGLGRQGLAGLWLTHIGLQPGQLSLRGMTRNPKLVPTYMDRLVSDPAFEGLRFSQVELQRQDERPGEASFLLEGR